MALSDKNSSFGDRSLPETTAVRVDNELQPRKRRKIDSGGKTGLASKEQYTKRLSVLHNVRDLLQLENDGHDAFHLRLPQIIVVGSQSDGKSSLLSCLTDIDFPEKSGICTKAPIVVECTYDASLSSNQYCVRDPSSNEYVSCDATSVAKRISDIQDVALCGCNGQEFKVSKDEIRVRVSGPEQMDIIIIDLPGIITNGEGQEETKELIRQYGLPDETLILLVTKAETDEELLPALDLAKEVDPKEARTLRVLTKFDQFGNPDAKERALELVHSSTKASGVTLHAVICRSRMENGSMAYCAITEMNLLREHNLPRNNIGVAALKQRLPPIFSQLIGVNLPKLQAEATSHRQLAESRLAQIGWDPADPTHVVLLCREKLLRNLHYFEANVSRELLHFQEEIHKTGSLITQEFTDENYPPNVFRVAFFYGEEAVVRALEKIVALWTPITEQYIASINDLMSSSLDLEQDTVGVSQSLLEYLKVQWGHYCVGVCHEFRLHCLSVLENEKTLGTVNHYLQDKFHEEILLPEEVLKKALSEMTLPVKFNPNHNCHARILFPELVSCLEQILLRVRKEYAAEFGKKTLHDQQKHRVFSTVKAIWSVEIKTFTDNILKETRNRVISRRRHWIEFELHNMLPELREKAVDSVEIVYERASLKDIVERMSQIEAELRSINTRESV